MHVEGLLLALQCILLLALWRLSHTAASPFKRAVLSSTCRFTHKHHTGPPRLVTRERSSLAFSTEPSLFCLGFDLRQPAFPPGSAKAMTDVEHSGKKQEAALHITRICPGLQRKTNQNTANDGCTEYLTCAHIHCKARGATREHGENAKSPFGMMMQWAFQTALPSFWPCI